MNAPEHLPHDYQVVDLYALQPSPTNPRKTFDADKLAELTDSIRQVGILQPILVRPWPMATYVWPGGNTPTPYEIVAGERRWRAAVAAELATVPVLVRHLNDQETEEFQVVENLQREDLHPIEEAEGYELLIKRHHLSADELADKIGKSRAYVYARLKLTALCPEARQAFRDGHLSASTALLVARIPGEPLQKKCLEGIVNGWSGPMPYRQAAAYVQNHYMLRLDKAPFDRSLADLVDGAGPCTTCPQRSGNQPELFADVTSADVCTDPACHAAKKEAWIARQRADAEAQGREVITGKAAEKILTTWSSDPTRTEEGFVALDARCEEVAQATPTDDPEPEEPDEDADEDAWMAYEQAHEAWSDRMVAALPTYRELLADAGVPTQLVQHPKTGEVIEVAVEADIAGALQAKGVDIHVAPIRPDYAQEQREKEKRAKAETHYREVLLDRVIDNVNRDLGIEDLRTIAASVWSNLWHEHKKRLAKLLVGEPTRENIEAIASHIEAGAINLNVLLLACGLVGEVPVGVYSIDGEPERLLAACQRWGVDPQGVRQEIEGGTGQKKGKVQPQTAKPAAKDCPAVKYRDPGTGMTWTGRGRKPKWVEAWLKEGRALEDLEVAA